MKKGTTTVTVRLPTRLVGLLKILAKVEQRSLNNLLNRALTQEVKKLTEPAK